MERRASVQTEEVGEETLRKRHSTGARGVSRASRAALQAHNWCLLNMGGTNEWLTSQKSQACAPCRSRHNFPTLVTLMDPSDWQPEAFSSPHASYGAHPCHPCRGARQDLGGSALTTPHGLPDITSSPRAAEQAGFVSLQTPPPEHQAQKPSEAASVLGGEQP